MRVSFPLLLVLSLCLHLSLLTGIVLSPFIGAAKKQIAATQPPATVLIFLRSYETPDFHPAPAAVALAPAASKPIPGQVPVIPAVVSPTQSSVDTTQIASVEPSPTLALAANPDARIRDLPPEAILSPRNAPHLDGSGGVVFLLDISGSMYEPYNGATRLAFARQVLGRYISALKDGTPFAIVLYGERAQPSGPLVAANSTTRDAALRFIAKEFDCGGGTNLPAGFAAAKALHTGSMVLATDGDLNTTWTQLMANSRAILGTKGHCPALSIVGISPRPYVEDGPLLQGLADQQGGAYQAEDFQTDGALVTSAPAKTATATP